MRVSTSVFRQVRRAIWSSSSRAARRDASAAFPPDPVRVARPEHLLPEDHVVAEPIFLLHCEEAAQVALGEIELAQPRQHHDVKAGVPEPLEGIGFRAGAMSQ
jgi:hypothetical protein